MTRVSFVFACLLFSTAALGQTAAVLLHPGTTSWTVPSDYTDTASSRIVCIGGGSGGAGADTLTGQAGGGGAGAALAVKNGPLGLSAGQTVNNIQVGVGSHGGAAGTTNCTSGTNLNTSTWFNGTSPTSAVCGAIRGGEPPGCAGVHGVGGSSANASGDVKQSGGNGGDGVASGGSGAGGAAAGIAGAGQAGGSGSGNTGGIGGIGTAPYSGSGGNGGNAGPATACTNATNYGAGGAGASGTNNGCAGSDGVIAIEFIPATQSTAVQVEVHE